MLRFDSISDENVIAIAELAFQLWPDSSFESERDYFQQLINADDKTAFHALYNDQSAGFVLVSLRNDYVEGCSTKPVCYIEGIFVKSEYRKKGIAQSLVAKAIEWGKEKKCTEIASDAEITNTVSIEFHKRIGFREINRVVCFSGSN